MVLCLIGAIRITCMHRLAPAGEGALFQQFTVFSNTLNSYPILNNQGQAMVFPEIA
jgi:hypothetical protein